VRKQCRLVEIMRSIAWAPGGTGFGFRPNAGGRHRQAAIVATCAFDDAEVLAAAIDAGVDAVELRLRGAKDLSHLDAVLSGRDVPFGVVFPGPVDAEVASQAASLGVDWIRVSLDARISTLEWRRPARLLTLPFELSLDLAPGVNGLDVDAVVVEQGPGTAAEFNYADALRWRALGEAVKKPMVMHAGPGLPPESASACAKLGADALLLDLESARSIEQLKVYLRAIEKDPAGD
jgi:hypothetical protein